MATFLIVSGGIVCALGLASLIGGVPLLVSGFDPTMVEAGTVGFVGGLLIIGVGSLLKAVRQLGVRPERQARAEDADVETPAPVAPRSASPHHEVAPRDLPPRREPRRAETPREPVDAEVDAARRNPSREPIAEAQPTMHAPPPAVAAAPTQAAAPPAPAPQAPPPPREPAPSAPPHPENPPPPESAAVSRPDPFRAAWQKAWEQGWEGEASAGPRDAAAPEATATSAESPAPDHSVVKSGVIGGMRYTLYADGSIEAELAEGLVRFPSVQALRAHVERAEAARSSGD